MRTTLLSLLILFVASIALAEPPDEDILRPRIPTHGNVFIGFDVGLNTTWFDGNPIYRAFFPSEEESRMFRSGFGFEPFGGLYVGMRLTPDIRVKLRGDYDIRVADRAGETIDSCPLIDAVTGDRVGTVAVPVGKEFRLQISYVTLSLTGEYHMGQVFLFGGPSWAMPVYRNFTETDHILDTSSVCIYFGETASPTHEITAEASGTDKLNAVWGFKLGVGYTIDMASNLHLVPQIGIDFPFTSALKEDEPFVFRGEGAENDESLATRLNQHMYFRVIQASIGLRYSF